MINVRPLIQQRIKSQVSGFTEVAGAAALEQVLKGRLVQAGCYVIPDRETDTPNQTVNLVSQQQDETYAVIYVLRNVADPRGGDSADACFTFRQQVTTALLGWTPDPAFDMISKVGGQLVKFLDGFYIWKDSFKTYQLIRSQG